MGKLHAVLAVLPSIQGAVNKILRETSKTFYEKKGLLLAVFKSYTPLDDEGEMMPDEGNKHIITTVGEKLNHFQEVFGNLLDATFQIDKTNTMAKANIVVDSETLLEDVPATYLMQFDKKLSSIREIFEAMPTLDPKKEWTPSQDGNGIFKAKDEITNRYNKELYTHVEYEATKEHPAQVQTTTKQVLVGGYKSQYLSGMITVALKAKMLKRIDTLQNATKKALSEANNTDHCQDKISDKIFGYLLDGVALTRAAD